ncbi:MAG: hypothetical protein ACKO5K_13160 [Armatimonadota bacterium]
MTTGLCVAMASGVVTAVATRRDPRDRAFLRALALAAWTSAMVVGGLWCVRGGPVGSAIGFAIMGRFLWYALACVAGAAIAQAARQATGIPRLGRIVLAVAAWYVAAFWLVFDPNHGEPHPSVEARDDRERAAAIGPKVGIVGDAICPGEGPCFLWSCDHLGDEWLFRFQRPIVWLWFRWNDARFFNPDRAPNLPAR